MRRRLSKPDGQTVLGVALIALVVLFCFMVIGGGYEATSQHSATLAVEWSYVEAGSFAVLFVGLVVLFALSKALEKREPKLTASVKVSRRS